MQVPFWHLITCSRLDCVHDAAAGHGGLAGSNSDRWAWRRGQQWLRSFLDFIADVERLMEGLLSLQPGPTRGDWYSKGHRLIKALSQIEEVTAAIHILQLPSTSCILIFTNLDQSCQSCANDMHNCCRTLLPIHHVQMQTVPSFAHLSLMKNHVT